MSNLQVQSAEEFDLASCDIQASLRPVSRVAVASSGQGQHFYTRSMKESMDAINSLLSSIVREQVMKR